MEANLESVEVVDLTVGEKHCGIIMPIGSMDGYSVEHWIEVKNIIIEATEQVDGINFKTNIVSQSDGEIDIIHKRIIQNLYNADIVICDMSGKNPNVMFELGMRLTFDKPTIIIKDDVTDFIFDTGAIEHLIYPKDLRFQKIVDFKRKLASRIKITYDKSQSDPKYSTFLGNFGEFTIAKIDQTAVSEVDQLVLDELRNLRRDVSNIKREAVYDENKSSEYIKMNDLNYTRKVVKDYIEKSQDFRSSDEIFADPKFVKYLVNENVQGPTVDKSILENLIFHVQSGLK
ncbi:hypothetical protein [Bacillus toyonensis]